MSAKHPQRLYRLFLPLLLIAGIALYLETYILTHYHRFTQPFDRGYLGRVYTLSQYVLGPLSKFGIGDDGLYAYAGYYYFFQKGDVSAVNFEHPPLGKYLIGLSIFTTGNENAINLLYFAFLLCGIFMLGKALGLGITGRLFSVALFVALPLVTDHLIRSQLDLPFTLFSVFALYFFLRAKDHRLFYILAAALWGIAFSVRFFPLLFVLLTYFGAIVVKNRRNDMVWYSVSLVLVPVIYVASHTVYFLYHPSIIEFIQHKRWMLSWFKGSPVIIGNIWRNVFTGKYLDPTGAWAINEHWSPLIPAIIVGAVMSWSRDSDSGTYSNRAIVWGYMIIFLLYITVGTTGVEKFLLPIYPLAVVLIVVNIGWFCRIVSTKWYIMKRLHARVRPSHRAKTAR